MLSVLFEVSHALQLLIMLEPGHDFHTAKSSSDVDHTMVLCHLQNAGVLVYLYGALSIFYTWQYPPTHPYPMIYFLRLMGRVQEDYRLSFSSDFVPYIVLISENLQRSPMLTKANVQIHVGDVALGLGDFTLGNYTEVLDFLEEIAVYRAP